MAFIVFFIDLNWNWRGKLLKFEYFEGKHSGTKLPRIVNPIFMKHDIDFRIFVLTIDNVGNNGTLYRHLIDFLPDTQYINLFDIGETEFIQFLQHVFCMAHIIQLVLKELFGSIRVSPTNEEFQKNWVDEKEKREFRQEIHGLPMTFAKIQDFIIIIVIILLLIKSRSEKPQFT